MKTGSVIGIVVLVAGAWVVAPLLSYAGGTVTGTVTYAGKAEEKEALFRSSPNQNFCPKIGKDGHKPELVKGVKRIIKTIEVGKGGALTAAVVAVTDIEDIAWMNGFKGTDVTIKFCEFLPFTGVVVNQRKFHVENGDKDPDDPKSVKGVSHTAHTWELTGVGYASHLIEWEGVRYTMDALEPKEARTIFNIGLPEKGSAMDKKVILRKEDQGSFLALVCDRHQWEQAYFLPVKNPHYVVTGADGSFTIKNVPEGKHKMIAWHPFAGKIEADIEVKEGATVTTHFRIKKKKGRRSKEKKMGTF